MSISSLFHQHPSPARADGDATPASATDGSYWLTRFVLLRLLGFIYLIAFLVAANQLVPLVGHNGLSPADLYLARGLQQVGSPWAGVAALPTLFWFGISDSGLLTVSWIGLGLSALLLVGFGNVFTMLALWALYMSIVNVGQIWYGYGWEMQLLETGFLAVFLCPVFDPRPFPSTRPPLVVFWLYRWLIFRIMVGAGLIKLRGDPCWRDLTCLFYHYETQPIPNPLSPWIHFRPQWIHKLGALWNHIIELVVPWFVFGGPYRARHIAGLLLVSFQLFLIASGNLSFLNWLTIVPCLACFDDSFWESVLPRRLVARARAAASVSRHSRAQEITMSILGLVVALLSIEPVLNLISPGQVMNTSFNRLNLVNTYGAFGSVGRERDEIIFEGTSSATPDDSAVWQEYEFKAKPGDPRRRPALVAPYHLRLDWQIWFAAMASPGEYPWTIHFVWKLLHNDPGTLSLLAKNPFPGTPPRYIRATLYRYHFTPLDVHDGTWWRRERIRTWLPAVSAEEPALRSFIEEQGWLRDSAQTPAQ